MNNLVSVYILISNFFVISIHCMKDMQSTTLTCRRCRCVFREKGEVRMARRPRGCSSEDRRRVNITDESSRTLLTVNSGCCEGQVDVSYAPVEVTTSKDYNSSMKTSPTSRDKNYTITSQTSSQRTSHTYRSTTSSSTSMSTRIKTRNNTLNTAAPVGVNISVVNSVVVLVVIFALGLVVLGIILRKKKCRIRTKGNNMQLFAIDTSSDPIINAVTNHYSYIENGTIKISQNTKDTNKTEVNDVETKYPIPYQYDSVYEKTKETPISNSKLQTTDSNKDSKDNKQQDPDDCESIHADGTFTDVYTVLGSSNKDTGEGTNISHLYDHISEMENAYEGLHRGQI